MKDLHRVSMTVRMTSIDRLSVSSSSRGPHAGGAFLLRASYPPDYPFRPFALRMLTPLYHPTVGPQGVIAVLGHDPYHHRVWRGYSLVQALIAARLCSFSDHTDGFQPA